MLRLISCLDIKNNFVVKGIKFKNLKIINNPIDLINYYEKNNIDELILLDITSNYTKKSLSNKLIRIITKKINKPISIGGGVKTIQKVIKLLNIGADRIIINSYCYSHINIIKKISNTIGSQSIIIAVDFKYNKNFFYTYKNSGFYNSNFKVIDWLIIVKKFGAGEILLTSIDNDGSCYGYNYLLYYKIKNNVNISIIPSGGMGSINDIYYMNKYCKINTFLIASLFHNKLLLPNYIKKYYNIYI